MPLKPSRYFHVQEDQVQHLLFCDNSDTEDALPLDEEDLEFLENDVDAIEQAADGVTETEAIEVVIDPPSASSDPLQSQNFAECSNSSSSVSSLIRDVKFSWNKEKPSNSIKSGTSLQSSFDYGKLLLPVTSELSPYEVFEKVANFDKFLQDILLPQTMLYSEQKGHVFHLDIDELKAFFGICIVMGYHILPSLRDYWSSDFDLAVPYVANVMPLKRFEEIRAF